MKGAAPCVFFAYVREGFKYLEAGITFSSFSKVILMDVPIFSVRGWNPNKGIAGTWLPLFVRIGPVRVRCWTLPILQRTLYCS